jgi:AcrR family transcriptional regulator
MGDMAEKSRSSRRREESLSREQIIEAAIELLDGAGEGGLTFRTLSERLVTGPGAIYWHIASKSALLTAACDAVVARTLSAPVTGATPEAIIRAFALDMFDAIDAHPWIGSALTLAPDQLPLIRIFERIGRQVQALDVPDGDQWATVSALLSYILGVAGQNAANGQIGAARGLNREHFLDAVSTTWSQLDADAYPFARRIAGQLRDHDDRKDFLAGIDLILSGIRSHKIESAAADF